MRDYTTKEKLKITIATRAFKLVTAMPRYNPSMDALPSCAAQCTYAGAGISFRVISTKVNLIIRAA